MDSIDSLFASFGGPSSVGRAIGKSTEHAASMRRRGSIPVAYWQSIVSEAERRGISGVTYEALVAIHSPQHGNRPGSAPAEAEATP